MRDGFEPGEIVTVPFPYTDLSAAKRRPALVLSSRAFNDAGDDVVVCAMTSRLENSAWSVLVNAADLDRGSLPRPSRVKVGKVTTLHKRVVQSRVGRLKASAFAAVMKEFEALFA